MFCKLQELASSLSYAENNVSVWCDFNKGLLAQTILPPGNFAG